MVRCFVVEYICQSCDTQFGYVVFRLNAYSYKLPISKYGNLPIFKNQNFNFTTLTVLYEKVSCLTYQVFRLKMIVRLEV